LNGSDIEFDWDEANIDHIARHGVTTEEAEQVVLEDPIDISVDLVEGEERYQQLGMTRRGRILFVVTTWRENRLRVVTAFEPGKDFIDFYYEEREN
jgi:uncharacterized DUF497 family protein